MTVAFLFPGQGAQTVGMGRDLYEAFPAARRIFDLAEEALEMPLKRLCFEGPDEELSRTDVCQPAILTASAATLAAMDDLLGPEAPRPTFAAGLSLGEYTALYAAGAIDFPDALRLVARRGTAMQQAAITVDSGMVSVLGLEEEQARALCAAAADGQILTCANFNCPGQIVLSGEKAACERALERAEEFGATRALPLNVAGAFHCELMTPAAEQLRSALEAVEFRPPAEATVVANVDAEPYRDAAEIPEKLLGQLTCPVRWQQCVETLIAEGADTFYEIGPGRVLAGLMRRIDRRHRVTCINSRESLEALAGS